MYGALVWALISAAGAFMSFQAGPQDALANAGRLLKEGGAQSVKLEGGQRVAETVDASMVISGVRISPVISLPDDIKIRSLSAITKFRSSVFKKSSRTTSSSQSMPCRSIS